MRLTRSDWLACLLTVFVLVSQPLAADQSFLVDADWLGDHLQDEKLVVLEVRYHPHRYFTIGHIPGAVQVQRFKDLGDNQASPLMRFPSQQAFQATLQEWGIDNDSTLVIYDDSGTALAARLYYLLVLYGFPDNQVKILNGSTIDWTVFNDLEKDVVQRQPGSVTLTAANANMMIDWTDIYDDVISRRSSKVTLLDARPSIMYNGDLIQNATRGGHIPGAINIVGMDAVDPQSQRWLPSTELAALYKGIPKDQTIYAYCHDGFRMSLAWLQLTSLGYQDIRLYNGGWSHWGNRLALPVVRGDQPYDEEYEL